MDTNTYIKCKENHIDDDLMGWMTCENDVQKILKGSQRKRNESHIIINGN